jgi:hypothetical protein
MFAYRQFIQTLCVLLFVLSILACPLAYIYQNSDGYGSQTSRWDKYSLGNLGYGSKQCSFTPFQSGNLHMMCPYGYIGKIVNEGIGLNRNGIQMRDACIADPSFENKNCS